MSIITVWNDGREQSGRTLTSVAIATKIAIERNSKILLISTSFDDPTFKNCFWGEEQTKNATLFGGKMNNIAVENGIEGLMKLATSNKLEASSITDYTRVILKGRLEVIAGPSAVPDKTQEENQQDYQKMQEHFIDLIRVANQYYDLVIVDLDKMLKAKIKEEILRISNVNVYVLSQKLASLNRYIELKDKNQDLIRNKCIPVIGKYIDKFKYNSKNIARFLGQKKELDLLPLNLLYMEAAEEACVVELFLKLKNLKDKTDENYIFMENILELTNNIMKRLQELQMRMR